MDIVLSEFIQHYFVAIVTCIGLIMFLYLNKLVSKRVLRIFSGTVIMIVLVIVSETFERKVAADASLIMLRKILSAIGYISRVGILYFLIQVPMRNRHIKFRLLNTVPFAVCIILVIVSIPTGIIFGFDEENMFVRGSLGIVPFIVSAFYLLELVVSSFVRFRRKEYKEGAICTFAMVFCVAAVFLETVYELTGLLPGIAIISIAFYYTNFVVTRYSRDQLTDMFLRSKFFDDSKSIRRPTYIVSIDVNGLKQVNDTKGHPAGDSMLEKFAEAAYSSVDSQARLYRIGGDEFAILYQTEDESKVIGAIERIKHNLADTDVSFSVGYALCADRDGFTKAFAEADSKMYDDKAKYYELYPKDKK